MEGKDNFSSLTCNELFDGGNSHARSNEHTTINYEIRLVNKDRSMQDEEWGRICVGYVISWWSPWDEENDSRSKPFLVEISPSNQEFDLQLKSPDIISLKAGLLLLDQSLTRHFRSHLRIVMGIGRLKEHNPFY